MIPYTPPRFNRDNFNCPHCQMFALQAWRPIWESYGHDYQRAHCPSCGNISIWHNGKMIYPLYGSAPPPNPDMPPKVKEIYEESRQIYAISSRASAALLRVCIEKIIEDLGEKDGNLNTRIGNLVKKGLPIEIQKALDVVRVTGNDVLHVGQIDLNDSSETAYSLFGIVNVIIQRMVSEKKMIDEIFAKLPQEKQDGIADRDKKI